MNEFITLHGLDLFTTLLGLLYIWLEYRAHIAVWLVGIIMPMLDIWLYYSHGLYGDAGMATYYTLAGLYGYAVWKWGPFRFRSRKKEAFNPEDEPPKSVISHLPRRLYAPMLVAFLIVWGVTWYVLHTWTDSTVPVLDAFTNALSIVALWALSHKYVEQWLFWIVVDAVCCYLYVVKGIPFKALLYGLYVVIAVAGYRKWQKMAKDAAAGRS